MGNGAFLVGTEVARSAGQPPPGGATTDGHTDAGVDAAAAGDQPGGPVHHTEDDSLSAQESLDELGRLAATAGLQELGRYLQRRRAPDPRTFVGAGALDAAIERAKRVGATALVFDDQLEPTQLRNIERRAPETLPVIDRTALILDIFARHATSAEGKLQVELAQLEYRRPRLTRMWTHLARQAGGGAGGGGGVGVGLRGPGETQLEIDRRRIDQRLGALRRQLGELASRRDTRRQRRRESGVPLVALVGYTNAGKTTLLASLLAAGSTGSRGRAGADRLFATLDPLTRRLDLGDGRRAFLTDTVGFIQKLPHQVVAAFQSTLREALDADLLLHVVDGSHPLAAKQRAAAEAVLAQLGAADVPTLQVLNKADLVAAAPAGSGPGARVVTVSAKKRHGIEDLRREIRAELDADLLEVRAEIPYSQAGLVDLMRRTGTIIGRDDGDTGMRVHASVAPYVLGQLRRQGVVVAHLGAEVPGE